MKAAAIPTLENINFLCQYAYKRLTGCTELFVLSSVLKHVSGASQLTEGSRSAHMGKFELEKTLEVGMEFGTDTSIGKYAVHFHT